LKGLQLCRGQFGFSPKLILYRATGFGFAERQKKSPVVKMARVIEIS
jgi:hypothetical protein